MYRLCRHGTIIGYAYADDSARADFNPISDLNIPNQHCTCTDEYIISDDGRLFMYFADGHILINTAVCPDFRISGNKDAVQSVGQGRAAFNNGVRADISAVAMRTAKAEKQKKLANKFIVRVLL